MSHAAKVVSRPSPRRAILARHSAGVATAARLVGCCTAGRAGEAERLFAKLERLIDLLGPACCGQPWGQLIKGCRRLFASGERLAVRGDLVRLAKQMRAARRSWPADDEPIDLALVPNEP